MKTGVLVLHNSVIKSKVLKIFFVFLIIFVCVSEFPSAYSAEIDGIHSGDEWDSAVVTKLFDGESNCGVGFALVQTMIDIENRAVYFCFMHRDVSVEPDNINTGVVFSVGNSEWFEVTPEMSPTYSDSSEYSFEGAVSVDEDHGVTTEIRTGFKSGIPEEIKCSVRFIDSSGAMSNVYNFTVINDKYTETDELIITQNKPVKTEKEAAVKTTKEPKETTEKDSEDDVKSTSSVKKSEEFVIASTPRRYTYVRTTRPPETKKNETQIRTSAKQKAATVYYYEKEIIVSQVYVTQSETQTTAVTVSETAAEDTTAFILSSEPETKGKSTFTLSEGAKKKTVIGVLAAISFTAIAVAGTRNSKRTNEENDNPDSQ